MNDDDEFKRFVEHLPRTGIMCVLLFCLHTRVKEYEKDPRKPFSLALAFVSVGYVVFQLAHAFARTKFPHSIVFDIFSILCGFAAIALAFTVIFSN